MMRLARSLVSVTLAASAIGTVQPAAAEPFRPPVISPYMHLSIVPGAHAHSVCAFGYVDPTLSVVATWEVVISGARTGVSPIVQNSGSSGPTHSVCMTVPKLGASSGQYHVAFVFAGVGLNVVGKVTGFGSWHPVLADVGMVLPA